MSASRQSPQNIAEFIVREIKRKREFNLKSEALNNAAKELYDTTKQQNDKERKKLAGYLKKKLSPEQFDQLIYLLINAGRKSSSSGALEKNTITKELCEIAAARYNLTESDFSKSANAYTDILVNQAKKENSSAPPTPTNLSSADYIKQSIKQSEIINEEFFTGFFRVYAEETPDKETKIKKAISMAREAYIKLEHQLANITDPTTRSNCEAVVKLYYTALLNKLKTEFFSGNKDQLIFNNYMQEIVDSSTAAHPSLPSTSVVATVETTLMPQLAPTKTEAAAATSQPVTSPTTATVTPSITAKSSTPVEINVASYLAEAKTVFDDADENLSLSKIENMTQSDQIKTAKEIISTARSRYIELENQLVSNQKIDADTRNTCELAIKKSYEKLLTTINTAIKHSDNILFNKAMNDAINTSTSAPSSYTSVIVATEKAMLPKPVAAATSAPATSTATSSTSTTTASFVPPTRDQLRKAQAAAAEVGTPTNEDFYGRKTPAQTATTSQPATPPTTATVTQSTSEEKVSLTQTDIILNEIKALEKNFMDTFNTALSNTAVSSATKTEEIAKAKAVYDNGYAALMKKITDPTLIPSYASDAATVCNFKLVKSQTIVENAIERATKGILAKETSSTVEPNAKSETVTSSPEIKKEPSLTQTDSTVTPPEVTPSKVETTTPKPISRGDVTNKILSDVAKKAGTSTHAASSQTAIIGRDRVDTFQVYLRLGEPINAFKNAMKKAARSTSKERFDAKQVYEWKKIREQFYEADIDHHIEELVTKKKATEGKNFTKTMENEIRNTKNGLMDSMRKKMKEDDALISSSPDKGYQFKSNKVRVYAAEESDRLKAARERHFTGPTTIISKKIGQIKTAARSSKYGFLKNMFLAEHERHLASGKKKNESSDADKEGEGKKKTLKQ